MSGRVEYHVTLGNGKSRTFYSHSEACEYLDDKGYELCTVPTPKTSVWRKGNLVGTIRKVER